MIWKEHHRITLSQFLNIGQGVRLHTLQRVTPYDSCFIGFNFAVFIKKISPAIRAVPILFGAVLSAGRGYCVKVVEVVQGFYFIFRPTVPCVSCTVTWHINIKSAAPRKSIFFYAWSCFPWESRKYLKTYRRKSELYRVEFWGVLSALWLRL